MKRHLDRSGAQFYRAPRSGNIKKLVYFERFTLIDTRCA